MDQKNLFKEYEKIFQDQSSFSNEVESKDVDQKKGKSQIFSYSPFALQDAVGERNIKKTWIEYQKLLRQDVEPDELIFKVVSKVRDMLSIIKGASATDLGIKDFPYNKSKRDTKNWKEKDLENFYTKLIFAYHKSRSGGDSLDLALEKLLLQL